MENFEHGSLKIELSKRGRYVTMTWLGQSDDRNPAESLMPYLNGLIGDLKETRLTIDFTKLEYMNSSTVPPIVQLLKTLDVNEIQTVITYDAQSHWQRASFKGLSATSLMMKNITVEGV